MSAPSAKARRSRVTAWRRRPSWSAQLSSVVAIVAAVVVAAMLNILSARHYHRWDWTTGGLYSLSPRTVQTLHALSEPVQIYVLLSGADPLTVTLRHLLEAYSAQTGQLSPRFVDPDRQPAEFLAVQRRYGIMVGKTEGGQIVTDAAIVVVRGKRHHFVTTGDLVEIDDPADPKARPRVEQALTNGIRRVVAGEAPKVCVTTGHGEDSIHQAGAKGLASLADRLQKTNYEVVELPARDELEGADEIGSCAMVVVAGPKRRVPAGDVARLRAYLEQGGSALLALGPIPDLVTESTLDVGLGPVLAVAGIEHHDDFVFELDDMQRSTHGFGEAFEASPKQHAITAGLLDADEHDFEVYLEVASSLGARQNHAVAPAPVLGTSEDSFGMVDFFAWARDPSPPEAEEGDRPGPLVVAFAAELPTVSAGRGPGPRVVVIGASNVLQNANWQIEELRGTALFVESAISWLAAQPIALDIPAKPSRPVGLRMNAAALGAVLRTCLLYVPLAVVLLGVGITLRRRSTEGRSRRQGRPEHDRRRGPPPANGSDEERAATEEAAGRADPDEEPAGSGPGSDEAPP